jgi:hypothetical protein
MASKTNTDLKAQIDAGIKINGNKEITPPIHNSIETNIIDSMVNVKDGGYVMEALFGQSVYTAPLDDRHFVTKKYVDDTIPTTAFVDGGNSFTADASIGTNDAFDLIFKTDGTENARLDTTGLLKTINGYSQGSNVLLQESGSRVMMGSLTDAKGIDVYTGGIKVMWADYADYLNFDNTSGVIFKRNGSECLRFTSDGSNNVMLAQVPFFNNSDNKNTSDLFQRKLYRNNGDEALNWSDMQKHSVSPTAPNRTVQVSVNGETIYLHGKTTND